MKLRRFTDAGVAKTRAFLAAVKESNDVDAVTLGGQPFTRATLLSSPAYSDAIPALADLDLDETRTFDTTFAFCEYFDSLIHDHNPQAYREDVGFWTWLAMVYLPQLVKAKGGKVQMGNTIRYIFSLKFTESHRHLLASPFYIYELYSSTPKACKCVLWNKLWAHSEIHEQIAARQPIIQNPALMQCVYSLYFDDERNCLKRGGGGSGPGSPRRFIVAVDQFARTRDFFDLSDANEFLKILPTEFDRFNPLKA